MNKEEILEELKNWDEEKLQELYLNQKKSSILLESRHDLAICKQFRDIRHYAIWRWSYEYGLYIESKEKIEIHTDHDTDGELYTIPFGNTDKFLCQVHERKDSIYLYNSSGKIEKSIFLGNFSDCQCVFSRMIVVGNYLTFGYFESCNQHDGLSTMSKFPIFDFMNLESEQEQDQEQKFIQIPPSELSRVGKVLDIDFKNEHGCLYDLGGQYFYIVLYVNDYEYHFLFDHTGQYMYNLEEYFQDSKNEMFNCNVFVDGCKISTSFESITNIYKILPTRLEFIQSISKDDAVRFPLYTQIYKVNGQVIGIDNNMFRLLSITGTSSSPRYSDFIDRIYLQTDVEKIQHVQTLGFHSSSISILGTSNRNIIYKTCVQQLPILGQHLAILVGDYI